MQILTPDRTDAQEIFLNTILRYSVGSNYEYPLRNIIRAIGHPQNQAFFRHDAALATIILTNEGSDLNTPQDVITAIQNQFGNEKKFFVYGIIDLVYQQTYLDNIKTLARQTGGSIHDIETTDYSPILQNISQSLKINLAIKEIPLRYQNVIRNTVSLTFTPSSNRVGWNFDEQSNKIVLDQHLPDNTSIQISYSYQVQ